MADALERQSIVVDRIGPLNDPIALLSRGKSFLYRRLLRKRYLRSREPRLLNAYARQISRRLADCRPDVVFSPGTIAVSTLRCRQPIVIWTGATFARMVDFYPCFTNLCLDSLHQGHRMEQSALDGCALAIYASDWAAASALETYKVDPSKVRVIPYGANLVSPPTLDTVLHAIAARPLDRCRLLFIGVDWHRKGGDVALQVAEELNVRGLPAELTIVGCTPQVPARLERMAVLVGYVDKSSAAGRNRLDGLLAGAHFLIVPSRAEAFGVASCEANAYGVPSLASRVGGVPSAIRDDVNGRVFAASDGVPAYSDYTEGLMADYPRYRELALTSRAEFENRLNWSVAGREATCALQQVCG
jgi:glycosyltransferase involved in cell wall biosynthesis